MTLRRLLPLLALIALLVAPFGRLAAAEAMMPGHAAAPAMVGHCDDMEPRHHDKGDRSGKAGIDCLIACAAVATPVAACTFEAVPGLAVPAAFALPIVPGLHPEAEPPPPRPA